MAHRICIFGAGAIGGLIGVRLAQAGHEVSFIARGAHLAALREKGASLSGEKGEVCPKIPAGDDPAAFGPQDAVILAVKAPAAPAAARAMAPLLGPDTAVVTAMNGVPFWYFAGLPEPWTDRRLASVDPEGVQWDWIGPRRAIGAVCYVAAAVETPGHIRHVSGRRIVLGELDGRPSARLLALSAALQEAGFDAPVSADIRTEVWTKLWGNLAFNPISVLTQATLDVLATDPDSVAVVRAMMEEAAEVACRLGVLMPMSVEERIALTRQAGPHETSMLQDLKAGRPTELASILGAVIEMAAMVQVAAPMSGLVHGLVRQRLRTARLFP